MLHASPSSFHVKPETYRDALAHEPTQLPMTEKDPAGGSSVRCIPTAASNLLDLTKFELTSNDVVASVRLGFV